MLLKIVSLFLVFIVVLGMFGKLSLLLPGKLRAGKCPACGRHRIDTAAARDAPRVRRHGPATVDRDQ